MISADADVPLDALKTGDLVLFAGRGLTHGLAWWFKRSPWRHVGLVLRRTDDAEPLLWEAACGGLRRGTLLSPLAARTVGSRSGIGVRCLNRPLAPLQCQRLEAFRQEAAARARARGLFDLIGAAEDGWLGGRRDNLGDPMDGELVAEAYQRIGLLDEVARGGKAPSEYRPWHFAESAGLELKSGYVLGPGLRLRDLEHAADWSDISPQPASA